MNLPFTKKYIIFGAGDAGQQVLKSPLNFAHFIDNDIKKQGTFVHGIPIKSPAAIRGEKNDCFIIIANYLHSGEIARQLENMGLKHGEDFADFRDVNLNFPVIKQLRVNVTRKCNSLCLICNVWQEKPIDELTVDEMRKILRDPFFRNVQDVYITGGEPSAIPNFPEYIQMLVYTLPSIRSVSTVVNGLLPEKIEKMIIECSNICKVVNVWFGVSVSLDGFEEENDLQRGVKGSFHKVIDTIKRLKKHNVNLTISTTISKLNIGKIKEFYDYATTLGVPVNIKLGINANFFNNEDAKKYFEYNEEELFRLKKLFYSIAHNCENSEFSKIVALNQFYMLEGSKRMLSCPYLECTAASVSETGQLRYCCSKSKDLGSLKEHSAAVLFQNNRNYLEFMGYTNCLNCNADAFSWQSSQMKSIVAGEKYWADFYAQRQWITSLTPQKLIGDIYDYSKYDLLLTGFWGNETSGDVSLIKNIVKSCREKYGAGIIIASSLPFVTKYYLNKNGFGESISVISTHSKEYLNACYYVPAILSITPTKPYYPWIECAEFIASQNARTIRKLEIKTEVAVNEN